MFLLLNVVQAALDGWSINQTTMLQHKNVLSSRRGHEILSCFIDFESSYK